MRKRAIVLCGGGSRGAYEIGVWKSLLEHGITYDMVLGTSIGAINGALMAEQEFSRAEELWETLTIDKVIQDGINFELSLESMLANKENLIPFFKKYLSCKGADISPLREKIQSSISEKKLRSSPIDFGMVAVAFPSLKPVEMMKREIPEGKLSEWLLASAACFPAFPMCKIENKYYIDGGYYDNLPIDYAIRQGAEEIIAIDLNFAINHKEYLNRPWITYIKPSWDLGSFLSFEPEVMKRNRDMGYLDGEKALGYLSGIRYAFHNEVMGEWEDASFLFYKLLMQFESELTVQVRKAILRQTAKPMSSYLIEYTSSPLFSQREYFLRSIETAAELLDTDARNVYSLLELGAALIKLLETEESDDWESIWGQLRRTKELPEHLTAVHKLPEAHLMACLWRGLCEKEFREEAFLFLAPVLPKETAALLGLFSLKKVIWTCKTSAMDK